MKLGRHFLSLLRSLGRSLEVKRREERYREC